MKLLRAMFVIAFSLSVVATASARHADGDTQPCPTCEKIYDYLYRISVELQYMIFGKSNKDQNEKKS